MPLCSLCYEHLPYFSLYFQSFFDLVQEFIIPSFLMNIVYSQIEVVPQTNFACWIICYNLHEVVAPIFPQNMYLQFMKFFELDNLLMFHILFFELFVFLYLRLQLSLCLFHTLLLNHSFSVCWVLIFLLEGGDLLVLINRKFFHYFLKKLRLYFLLKILVSET